MSNFCVGTANKGGISTYEKRYGTAPTVDDIKPSGTVGLMQSPKKGHKLEPRGKRCTMLGLAHNSPSGT